ncbi:MAG: DUF2971 domain-containing protein [Bacteroidota bacterium]
MNVITRYMSLEKCLDFFSKRRLYLARFDSFEDQYEGYSLEQLAKKLGIKFDKSSSDNRKKLTPEKRKKVLFGSCWYQGQEDLAMWDRFRHERGLAISVNKESLAKSFLLADNKYEFDFIYTKQSESNKPTVNYKYADEIYYISERTRKKRDGVKLGLIKHAAFQHEQEFRFIVRQRASDNTILADGIFWKLPDFNHIDFTIRTNPYMKGEFLEMLSSYINTLKLNNVSVQQSQFRKLFTP